MWTTTQVRIGMHLCSGWDCRKRYARASAYGIEGSDCGAHVLRSELWGFESPRNSRPNLVLFLVFFFFLSFLAHLSALRSGITSPWHHDDMPCFETFVFPDLTSPLGMLGSYAVRFRGRQGAIPPEWHNCLHGAFRAAHPAACMLRRLSLAPRRSKRSPITPCRYGMD